MGCLIILNMISDGMVYLLFTGHSLTTSASSAGTTAWLYGNFDVVDVFFTSNPRWLRCTLARFFRSLQHIQHCSMQRSFRGIRLGVNVYVIYYTIGWYTWSLLIWTNQTIISVLDRHSMKQSLKVQDFFIWYSQT